MSAGGRAPLVLIVVALVLVGLYVVGAAIGAGGGVAGCSPSPATRASWREGWLAPAPVAAADLVLEGCTLAAGRLRFGATCAVEVRAGGGSWRARGLRLYAEAPFGLDFRPRGGDAVPLRADLAPGKSADLTIPRDGALALLQCKSGLGCSVRLE